MFRAAAKGVHVVEKQLQARNVRCMATAMAASRLVCRSPMVPHYYRTTLLDVFISVHTRSILNTGGGYQAVRVHLALQSLEELWKLSFRVVIPQLLGLVARSKWYMALVPHMSYGHSWLP